MKKPLKYLPMDPNKPLVPSPGGFAKYHKERAEKKALKLQSAASEEHEKHVKTGRFSRRKGRRGEQQLVLYLAKKGFKAERILRQYLQKGQPDVVAVREGQKFLFELKLRHHGFMAIYGLYEAFKGGASPSTLAICQDDALATAFAISTDVEDVILSNLYFTKLLELNPSKKQVKAVSRVFKLRALLQDADFLVLKDNNRPMLFIRYW